MTKKELHNFAKTLTENDIRRFGYNSKVKSSKYFKQYSAMKKFIFCHQPKQYLWHFLNNSYKQVNCKYCDHMANWDNINFRYKKVCKDPKCIYKKMSERLLKTEGIENPAQRYASKKKQKETFLKNYGGHPNKTEKQKNKIKKTTKERFGTTCFFNSKESFIRLIKKIAKNTNDELKLINFVTYTYSKENGIKEIYSHIAAYRHQTNFFGVKFGKHNETGLTYQGSYEKHFLDSFHNKFNIKNPPNIKYKHDLVKRTYLPDFYIEEKNLIIEIKSNYTFDKWKEKNLAKQKACLEQGYNFIFIIDKDYSEFEQLI